MTITFNEHAGSIATAISRKAVTTLEGFNPIVTVFYRCVCPAAFVIVDLTISSSQLHIVLSAL